MKIITKREIIIWGLMIFLLLTLISFASAKKFININSQHILHNYNTNIYDKLILVSDDSRIDSKLRENKICTKSSIYFNYKNMKTNKFMRMRKKLATPWSEICFDVGNLKQLKKDNVFQIHVGDTSDIYQLVEIVVYEESDFNITCSLKNNDGTYAEGTAWINNDTLKFGYNLTDSTWANRQYECYSKLPIQRIGDNYYFKNGQIGYKINTKDICNQYNPETDMSSNCRFSTRTETKTNETLYYVDVDFYGNNTDPQIVVEQTESNLFLNQTRWEQENFTHLEINNSNIIAYYPLDYGSNLTVRDYSNNDYDLSSKSSYANAYYVKGVIGNELFINATINYGGMEYKTLSLPNFNQNTDFTFSFWVNASKPFQMQYWDGINYYYPFGVGFDSMDLYPTVYVQNISLYSSYAIGKALRGIDILSDKLFLATDTYFIKVLNYDSSTGSLTFNLTQDDGTYPRGLTTLKNSNKVVIGTVDGADSLFVYDWTGTNLVMLWNQTDNVVNPNTLQSYNDYVFEGESGHGLKVWKWNDASQNLTFITSDATSDYVQQISFGKITDDSIIVFTADRTTIRAFKFNLTDETLTQLDTYSLTNVYGVVCDCDRNLVFTNSNGDLYVLNWDGSTLTFRKSYNSGQINSRDRYGNIFYDNSTKMIFMERYYQPIHIYKFNKTTNKITYLGRIGLPASTPHTFLFFNNDKMIYTGYKNVYSTSELQASGIEINDALSKINTLTHLIASYNSTNKILTMYVNGVKQSETTVQTGFNTAGTTFYLVGYNQNFLFGTIDETLILNKAISDTEASKIYQNQYVKFYQSGTLTTTEQSITENITTVNLTINTQQFNNTSVFAKVCYSNDNISYTCTNYKQFNIGTDTKQFNTTNNNTYLKSTIKLLSNSLNSYSSLTFDSIEMNTYVLNITQTTKQSNGIHITATPSWTQTYPSTSLINCSADNTTPNLYLNGSVVSNPFNTTSLSGGSYTFECNVSETAEFYGNSTSNTFTLNKGQSEILLYLNKTRGDITILNGSGIWINSTIVDGHSGGSWIEIWKDNILLKNESNVLYSEIYTIFSSNGSFIINTIYSGNQNYTNSSESWTITVTLPDTTPPNVTFISPTTPSGNTTNNYIEANVQAIDDNLHNITIWLYNDSGVLIDYAAGTTNPFYHKFTGLVNATYYLNATAYDIFGNVGKSKTRIINIQYKAPTQPLEMNVYVFFAFFILSLAFFGLFFVFDVKYMGVIAAIIFIFLGIFLGIGGNLTYNNCFLEIIGKNIIGNTTHYINTVSCYAKTIDFDNNFKLIISLMFMIIGGFGVMDLINNYSKKDIKRGNMNE